MKLTWRLSFSTFRMDRKQVQCLDCGKKLSSRDRLKQHMATQHSDNPPTFTCQCGKVFKSQIGLKIYDKFCFNSQVNGLILKCSSKMCYKNGKISAVINDVRMYEHADYKAKHK